MTALPNRAGGTIATGQRRQRRSATKFVGLVVVRSSVRLRLVHHCAARTVPARWRVDLAVLVSFIAAHFVYSVLLPAGATGSALALRAGNRFRFWQRVKAKAR
jgi:hypothetical protein